MPHPPASNCTLGTAIALDKFELWRAHGPRPTIGIHSKLSMALMFVVVESTGIAEDRLLRATTPPARRFPGPAIGTATQHTGGIGKRPRRHYIWATSSRGHISSLFRKHRVRLRMVGSVSTIMSGRRSDAAALEMSIGMLVIRPGRMVTIVRTRYSRHQR